MEESPLRSIELVEQWDNLRGIEPMIFKPLSEMGPIFLFYRGVVILMICSAAGELYGMLSLGEVAQEMMVKEFATIVAIEAS